MEAEAPDPPPLYSDDRETRIFDFRRYELSKQLPAVVESLMTRKCFHAARGNFFTIKVVDVAGKQVDYDIYFAVSKASNPGTINLFVQSAYTRDKGKRARQQKPISFSVILFNTRSGSYNEKRPQKGAPLLS